MRNVSVKLPKIVGTAPTNGKGYKLSPGMGNLDLKIYEIPKTECIRPSDDIPITECCSALKRLCTATKYLDVIKSSKSLEDEMKRDLFVEFSETVYHRMLDDTAHLIKEHEGDIGQIRTEWTGKYGLPKCVVSECTKSTRHYERERDEERKRVIQEADVLYDFYESALDRVHHYIYHLFEIGMRVDMDSLNVDTLGVEEKEDGSDAVDKQFIARRDLIRSRRENCKVDMDRVSDANSKFTIQSVSDEEVRVLLMDVLFQKLAESAEIENKKLVEIKEYFEDNSYDTDSIEMDVEDWDDSNIYSVFRDDAIVCILTGLIRSAKVHRNAFSTGFSFNYLVWKKKPWWIDEKMTVKPVHATLKEEIIEGGYLSVSKWDQIVLLKAEKYMKMVKTKKLIGGRALPYKECILQKNKGYPITMEHLLAVILYCDFSTLCTKFSATFRLDNVFEDLESLKRRHSHFVNFGRLLVEVVLDYGICGYHESGPFFSGLNCKLNIGSFAIILKGPCSTSIVSEVAVNFAKETGVILKLANDDNQSRGQCFFDCSWISNYVEEQERLWMSGERPLRIVEITVVETAKNYKKELRTLYLFDVMITGTQIEVPDGSVKCKVQGSSVEYDLLSKLIELELKNEMASSLEFDDFFKMEWKLFLQSKTEIKIDLYSLDVEALQSLSKLIMHDVVDRGRRGQKGKRVETRFVWKYKGGPKGNENVLKPEWLSIFPALREVKISTSGGRYQFGLEEMLESVKMISPAVTINITPCEEWGQNAVTSDVMNLYDTADWNICYKSEYPEAIKIKHKE